MNDDDNPAGIVVPEDLPDDSEDAYLLGVEHAARRFGTTAEALVRFLEARREEDVDESGCPDCGGELRDSFGGMTCLTCGSTFAPDCDSDSERNRETQGSKHKT